MTHIFLIEDDLHMRLATAQTLTLAGYTVEDFARAEGALVRLSQDWDGIIVSDIKMPEISGLDVLDHARKVDDEIPVILITGHGDVPIAVEAMRKGAYDFITKPFAPDILVETVRRAVEKRRLVLENRNLKQALHTNSGIEQVLVGRASEIVRLRLQILSFAQTDADVLIYGETGTGKEVVAKCLHDFGVRKAGPFVALNCGALPENIIESELFGHEAGAFTGAAKMRVGKMEYANGGTLFLDEIESMPLALQIKLLRVIQNRSIVRLGANEERPINVRILAATKEDLLQASNRGSFRSDLYYRLNVLNVSIAPLRDRREDIALLFQFFTMSFAERFKKDPQSLQAQELARLMAYDWPGNVRELQNVAMRFVLGLGLEIEGVPLTDLEISNSLPTQMEVIERQLIAHALRRNNNSLKATYEALGISRKTLYEKMRKLGLGKLTADDEDGEG